MSDIPRTVRAQVVKMAQVQGKARCNEERIRVSIDVPEGRHLAKREEIVSLLADLLAGKFRR